MGDDYRESAWWLRVVAGNLIRPEFHPDSPDAIRIVIEKINSTDSADIQLNTTHLPVQANQRYLVNFLVRADQPRELILGFAKAHEPWTNLGLYRPLQVTSEWQSVEADFIATEDDDNGRLHFDVGASAIAVEIAAVTVRNLSAGRFVLLPPPSSGEIPIGPSVSAEPLAADHGLPSATATPAGRLHSPLIPDRSSSLGKAPLVELTSELLYRIRQGAFATELTISLGCQMQDALRTALDTYYNRVSREYYCNMFSCFAALVTDTHVHLDKATIVDLGCGSVNPYGLLFLFLLLGAERGIAIDLDQIQNESRAVQALADCASMLLINPEGIIGKYQIAPEQILRNVASFDLAKLSSGDASGLDTRRLCYRQESIYELSLADGEADVVISNAMFEHIPHVDKAIVELARITRKGGLHIHYVDGADHRRYIDPHCHPLQFLTEACDDVLIYDCNRIRPHDFISVFENNGFELIAFTPCESIDISVGLCEQFVEPFKSKPNEVLSTIGGRLLLRRS